MIYGVFHGDLHGGNLVVTPEGSVALFDYGITGRIDGQQRLAFLRMMMTGAMNDVRGQLEAFRDLGALDADATSRRSRGSCASTSPSSTRPRSPASS